MIQRISVLDPLTGIYNRRRIGENIDLLKQQQSSFAIVLLDLDYFKSVNDQYGHDIGDAVLKQVAKILTENIRETGCCWTIWGRRVYYSLEQWCIRKCAETG